VAEPVSATLAAKAAAAAKAGAKRQALRSATDPETWKEVVGFFVGAFALFVLIAGMVAEAVTSLIPGMGGGVPSPTGLPAAAAPFLPIYSDAARVYGVNQFLLMAVHEDETAFSTSTAAGVRSGVNFAGCCAGPMQFSIVGARGGTWAAYADAYTAAGIERASDYPGRTETHPSVYDSFDSIYAAAKYFKALGAGPALDDRTFLALQRYKGTPPGSIPYARADYARALELQSIALANGGAEPLPAQFGTGIAALPPTDPWLAPVPGFPDARCDRRILPNLIYLAQRFKLAVLDCFALEGHARSGEHPLGLGVDLIPGTGGSWDLVDRLAAAVEPTQGQPVPPFRWVGYDGDANHGRGDHLHLSWDHSPAGYGQQAQTVMVAR
jgi:hypothetical protein